MKLDNDYRIKYYLGNASKPFKLKLSRNKKFQLHHEFNATKSNLIDAASTLDACIPTYYVDDLLEIYRYLPESYSAQPVLYIPGDINFKFDTQCLTKSRVIGDKRGTILKIEKDRHFELMLPGLKPYTMSLIEYLKSIDCPFHLKRSSIVYRGTIGPYLSKLKWYMNQPLGKARRYDLIHRYINNKRYNIAGSGLGDCPNEIKYTKCIKKPLTLQQMLQYKYIVSVEGNDLASNLKWSMLSNSVVMMPKPTTCSWFMEDHLEPFKHYIPLKPNFTDLDAKFEWCEDNPDICQQITCNATMFATQFYDKVNEMKLNREVLKRYIDNIK